MIINIQVVTIIALLLQSVFNGENEIRLKYMHAAIHPMYSLNIYIQQSLHPIKAIVNSSMKS